MQKATLWDLLKETFKSWNEDRAPRLAAALAYYTIFALAPLLLIAIAVAAMFFNEAEVRQNMLNEVGGNSSARMAAKRLKPCWKARANQRPG